MPGPHFLQLPSELRLQIYEIFLYGSPIKVGPPEENSDMRPIEALQLSLVCRQLHSEVSPLVLRHCTVMFDDPLQLLRVLRPWTPERRGQLRWLMMPLESFWISTPGRRMGEFNPCSMRSVLALLPGLQLDALYLMHVPDRFVGDRLVETLRAAVKSLGWRRLIYVVHRVVLKVPFPPVITGGLYPDDGEEDDAKVSRSEEQPADTWAKYFGVAPDVTVRAFDRGMEDCLMIGPGRGVARLHLPDAHVSYLAYPPGKPRWGREMPCDQDFEETVSYEFVFVADRTSDARYVQDGSQLGEHVAALMKSFDWDIKKLQADEEHFSEDALELFGYGREDRP
jgi:hypothetical protein